jgi:serpin B
MDVFSFDRRNAGCCHSGFGCRSKGQAEARPVFVPNVRRNRHLQSKQQPCLLAVLSRRGSGNDPSRGKQHHCQTDRYCVTGTDQQIDNNARLAVRTQLTSPTNAQFGIDVNVANSLWLAENYPIQPAFRSNAQQYFGAISTETNFADTAAAAKLINEWISTATKQQIENMISDTTLSPATKAVMVNALYFRAAWSRKFSKDQTVPAAFRLDTKRRVQAPTMTGNTTVRLTPAGTEVVLSFTAGFVMRILVPKKFGAAALRVGALELATNSITSTDTKSRVTCLDIPVSVPKWNSTTKVEDLKPALRTLGITDLFDETRSDLSGITTVDALFVDTAAHMATITVDEDGTTAAAVTVLVASPVSAPPPNAAKCPTSVRVDRPFTYVIQHVGTNEVLFAGKIIDPSRG